MAKNKEEKQEVDDAPELTDKDLEALMGVVKKRLAAQRESYKNVEKVKPVDSKNLKISFINPMSIWRKIQFNRNIEKAVLVNMELKTGDHRHFIAYYKDLEFEWNKKTYIVDDSLKYYDIDAAISCLDYHEDLALPIRRVINVQKLRKAITIPGITDVDMAINPTTLKYYVESQFVQKIQRGADLDKIFQLLVKLSVIVLIIVAIILILNFKMSGIFQNLKIPGLH